MLQLDWDVSVWDFVERVEKGSKKPRAWEQFNIGKTWNDVWSMPAKWLSGEYIYSYLSSLWKAGFWTKNASKKAWFNIHMIDNSFFKFWTRMDCLKRWDFQAALITENMTIIAATAIGSTPINVAFSTASTETEHSGRTMSKENAKNWTPSNIMLIDDGLLSASPEFWKKKEFTIIKQLFTTFLHWET